VTGRPPDRRLPGAPGRRRAAVALILSGVFPGLGQLYNRELVKGAAFLIAGAVLSWLPARTIPSDVVALLSMPLPASTILMLCALVAVWLWSVVDAWRVGAR
jgi:hypothetical protein